MPLVSIITPSYNSIRFIEQTINSIVNQTYTNWELLITDDCSTDGTWELVTHFSRIDNRIKAYRLAENAGAGVARNNSIEHATGRFIAFCDSDDQWKHNKLEEQIRYMLKNDLGLSYSNYDIVNEDNKKIAEVVGPRVVTYKTMLRNCYIGCLTAIYDTEKVGKVFMQDIRKRQDWVLWLFILKRTPAAFNIQDNLAIYRKRRTSISSNKADLVKYNWKVYYEILDYSFIRSFLLMVQFMVFYLLKKLKAIFFSNVIWLL